MKTYENKNAAAVLKNVESMIADIENGMARNYYIYDICNELSIFDWWNDWLSKSQLKDMRKFLREAIKLGYNGYVCFKVGATGCANGMWAHKEESTTGYSPEGEFLYKSFTPSYNYWSVKREDGTYFPDSDHYDVLNTKKQLEDALAAGTIEPEVEEEVEEQIEETVEEEPVEATMGEYLFKLTYNDGQFHHHVVTAENDVKAYIEMLDWTKGFIHGPSSSTLQKVELIEACLVK